MTICVWYITLIPTKHPMKNLWLIRKEIGIIRIIHEKFVANLWLFVFLLNTNSHKLSKKISKKIIFKIWANLWANLELGTLNYLRSVGVWEFRSVDNTLPFERPAWKSRKTRKFSLLEEILAKRQLVSRTILWTCMLIGSTKMLF